MTKASRQPTDRQDTVGVDEGHQISIDRCNSGVSARPGFPGGTTMMSTPHRLAICGVSSSDWLSMTVSEAKTSPALSVICDWIERRQRSM